MFCSEVANLISEADPEGQTLPNLPPHRVEPKSIIDIERYSPKHSLCSIGIFCKLITRAQLRVCPGRGSVDYRYLRDRIAETQPRPSAHHIANASRKLMRIPGADVIPHLQNKLETVFGAAVVCMAWSLLTRRRCHCLPGCREVHRWPPFSRPNPALLGQVARFDG